MTAQAPTYDLVMLLDPEAEEATRAKLVSDARAAIEAEGEVLRHDEWGSRALAYPIERRATAEYHLLQFHAAAPKLLGSLDRSLRIADGVLRFRIIKLEPGVGEAPDMRASTAAPAGAGMQQAAASRSAGAPPGAERQDAAQGSAPGAADAAGEQPAGEAQSGGEPPDAAVGSEPAAAQDENADS